jgi:hypothetical protein
VTTVLPHHERVGLKEAFSKDWTTDRAAFLSARHYRTEPRRRAVTNRFMSIQVPGEWLSESYDSINAAQLLPVGWDGYGGLPATEDAAHWARIVLRYLAAEGLPAPLVLPLPSGGISIESDASPWCLELEILPDGEASLMMENVESRQLWEGPLREAAESLPRW